MILLGYRNMLSDIKIRALLQKYQIRYVTKKMEEGGFIFIEIESENLIRRNLCCFGKREELAGLQRSIERYTEVFIKNRMKKTLTLLLSDVQFWIELIKKFVGQFGDMAIRRQYEDVSNVDHGKFYVSVNDLNESHLLSIEINQTMVVTRTQDSETCKNNSVKDK
jgi:hypothetical protein